MEVLCYSTLNVVTWLKNAMEYDCHMFVCFAALLVLTIHVERCYYSASGVFRGRERVYCVMMVHLVDIS